ncbi:cytochrome P450 [Actinoallomurus purpureus]|uniref:cytochrome P450 n=1 Tax=Actinoallomurus purpureus TaxID=478114 RepID=UPI002093AAEE|nr:cytochrome P450 [Actinoallomurus purpureus]MCO6006830.1 cytochrome P450 [Actinoallomurus purpureus]
MTQQHPEPVPPVLAEHPDAVPLYGPRYRENPAEIFRELRRTHGPVVPVLLEGDVFAWLVIGYRELHELMSDSQLFARDSRIWNQWPNIPPDWPLMTFVAYQPSILFGEGPDHQRRVDAMSGALSEVDQFELRARCEEIADALIDGFAGSGAAELMTQYVYSIPVMTVAWMMGISTSEIDGVARDAVAALDGGEGAAAAYGRLAATMQNLLAAKRAEPGPDVTSRMLAHPAALTDEELAADLLLVAMGGQEPTAHWIGNTLHLMLTDDRFSLTLSGGRRSVGQALNEVLWENAPVQAGLGRWATRDTQLGGRRIQAGDALLLGLAGANADPYVRPASGAPVNNAHMSFAHGSHGCPHPAPEIAEVIARTAVEVLLDRIPDVALAVPADELTWRSSFQMRGLLTLPVKFSPASIAGS